MRNSDEFGGFELDEPAARTHTPPGWPIKTLQLVPSGKAPKKYGPATFRFGAALTLSVILPRRGWTLVKKTKNYVYLIPPPGQSSAPFHISIAIPTPEECLELARRSHERGQSWIGQLGELPAYYLHEKSTDTQEIWRDPTSGQVASRLHRNPPESRFSIGEWGVWSVHVTGVDGEFRIGQMSPSAPLGTSGVVHVPSLEEGALKSVELTTYERNAKARRLCIEHYGTTCQGCGLNYEAKYGAIGADLIHVHHLTPLSAIGETYQVDPIRDLIPLCATCHHIVHSRRPPYSVAEIRSAIVRQGSPSQSAAK